MTSSKILLWLPFGIVLLIVALYHSPGNYEDYTDNTEKNAVKLQVSRHRRAIKPINIHYCKLNQYYDQDEGRCLGVPGGGKVLHVEKGQSCGINILKPHCKSSLYYHICKRNKSILAQCADRQIFDNRLQRCVYYDSSKLSPSIIQPDDHKYYNHLKVPNCRRRGRFPVPDHCTMFYACDTNGHRLHQSIFKCPQNTGYQADKGICGVMPDCENNNSVDSAVCVPDAPAEKIKPLSADKATEKNVEEISDNSKKSKMSVTDSVKKEDVNPETYNDTNSTIPVSVIDNPLSVDNHENSNNAKNALSDNVRSYAQSIEDVSLSDDKTSTLSQASETTESMRKAVNETQNEDNKSMAELDDARHSFAKSVSSIKPEYDTSVDVNSNLDNGTTDISPSFPDDFTSAKLDKDTQDVITEQIIHKDNKDETLSDTNAETVGSNNLTPTPINNIEFSFINDTSKLDKETQDVTTEQQDNLPLLNSNTKEINQDTLAIKDTPESSISDKKLSEGTQDVITKKYRNNDDSTITQLNSNTEEVEPSTSTMNDTPESSSISDVKLDELQDVTTEKYKNDDDSTVTQSNSNTEKVEPSTSTINDTSESSISDVKLDEETQDVTTEKYKNDDDSTVTQSNSNTEEVEPSTSTINNTSESSISDVKLDEETQDVTTEKYKNDDDSTVTQSNSNTEEVEPSTSTINDTSESSISDVKLDEETQNVTTEKYKNDDDSTVTQSNSNTEEVEPSTSTMNITPESSSISDVKLDEETQDVTTEKYKNDDNSTVTQPNLNSEEVEPSTSTITDTPESSSINI